MAVQIVVAPDKADVTAIGVSTGGNTAGNTGLRSGTIVFQGTNNITLSQSTAAGNNATIVVSGPTTFAQFTGGFSTQGNTAGNTGLVTGQLLLVGGNSITLSGSTAGANITITISGPTTVAPAQFTGGFSTQGNTSGNTGMVTGQLLLVGGNSVTLSGSTNAGSITITISGATTAAPPAQFTGGFSTQGNTSGDTGLVTGQVLLIGGNSITLSGSTQGGSITITISGATTAAGGGAPTLNFYNNQEAGTMNTASSLPINNLKFWPVVNAGVFPGNMTPSTVLLNLSFNMSNTTASTEAFTYTFSLGFFTISASSTLNLIFSASSTFAATANSSNSSFLHGPRWLSFHSSLFNVQPTFSQTEYIAGIWYNTSGTSHAFSAMGARFMTSDIRSGTMGVGTTTGNQTWGWHPWVGSFTQTFTSGMPSSIHISNISKQGNNPQLVPHIILNNLMATF